MTILSSIVGVLGILAVIYFVILIVTSGLGTAFAFFWLFLGGILIFINLFMQRMIKRNVVISKTVWIYFSIVFLIVVCFFGFVEGKIIYEANKSPKKDADYIIVLGAGVNGTVPSQTLKNRINATIGYLKTSPDSQVIASGGMGPGEEVSEAQIIKEYLLMGGISPEQIIVEDNSTSTVENIKFSKEFIHDNNANVVLVTSDFHIMRATKIAEMQGLTNISGCPAEPGFFTKLNNYVREFFAVIKDKVRGNI